LTPRGVNVTQNRLMGQGQWAWAGLEASLYFI